MQRYIKCWLINISRLKKSNEIRKKWCVYGLLVLSVLWCSHSGEIQNMDLNLTSTQKNRHAKKKKERSQRFQIKWNRIQIKINGQQWLLWYMSYYIVTLPKVLAKPLISGAPLMRSPYHYVSSQALVIMLISFLKV